MAGYTADALSADWCTPDWVIDIVHEVFGDSPDLDPCSNPYSRVKAKTEFTLEKGNDGLVDDWGFARTIYVNPPFGKGWWKANNTGRRDYIWPSNRNIQLEGLTAKYTLQGVLGAEQKALVKKDFNAWIKPYTKVDIGDWIKRSADYGSDRYDCARSVIGLIPAYPGTGAWQKHVWPRARAVFFPKGRLHFRLVYLQPDGSTVEKTGPAPMDCALPLWGLDHVHKFHKLFSKRGHVQLIADRGA
jgi:hypothetical protein